MTKKQEQLLCAYENFKGRQVEEVYKRLSFRKVAIERGILMMMVSVNGYDYRITSANSNFFSCAYRYRDELLNEHLVYHTYANTYDFIID